jgi:hypothetical protein
MNPALSTYRKAAMSDRYVVQVPVPGSLTLSTTHDDPNRPTERPTNYVEPLAENATPEERIAYVDARDSGAEVDE